MLTKKEATKYYKTQLFDPSDTWTDKRLKWNDFVENLRRDGEITEKQCYSWDQPDFVKYPDDRKPRPKRFKLKTIDVTAKEWFDRTYGNSYFSAVITLNYGMEDQKIIHLPFQYGYGDHYMDMAQQELANLGYTKPEKYSYGGIEQLPSYCRERKIILRRQKIENCKQKEVIQFGTP